MGFCSSPAPDAMRCGIRLSVHDGGAVEAERHKWIESEKAGHDIGFEKALLDWIVKYRSSWRNQRQHEHAAVILVGALARDAPRARADERVERDARAQHVPRGGAPCRAFACWPFCFSRRKRS